MKKNKDLLVLYEDNHIIAVNKPAGILVHGDESGDKTLQDVVKEYIKGKYNKPGEVFLGVTHRLDRPVAGVVVFARTSKALARLNDLFRLRQIKKNYKAIVDKRPPELEETLRHYIKKETDKNIAKASLNPNKGGKEGVLTYRFESEISGYILLSIEPETGRPHQIRSQLKSIGCPIVGDAKYGSNKKTSDRSVCLYCQSLTFIHPVKKEEIIIKAPMPVNEYWNLFRS